MSKTSIRGVVIAVLALLLGLGFVNAANAIAVPVGADEAVRTGSLTLSCTADYDVGAAKATYQGPAGSFMNVYVNTGYVSANAPYGKVIGTVAAGQSRTLYFDKADNGISMKKTVRGASAGQRLAYRQFDFANCPGNRVGGKVANHRKWNG